MVETAVIKRDDCTCPDAECDRGGGCTYCAGLEADVPCPKDMP